MAIIVQTTFQVQFLQGNNGKFTGAYMRHSVSMSQRVK